MSKHLTVVSLFDGGSCGQLALNELSFKNYTYYASEIEPNAIKVTQHNFPNTIQLGDVTKVKYKDGMLYSENGEFKVGEIDLLIGGSPCKNLSRTVINDIEHNQGLDGKESKLFYEMYRILKEIKPTYFMLENVESMKDKDKEIITECMGVDPIMINSELVSAQDRKRYYWTNIEVVGQPKDKGLYLKDIVLPPEQVAEKYWYKQSFDYHGDDKRVCATLHINGHDILKRVYNLNYKSPTLTTVVGGNQQKKIYQNGRCRKLTPLEYERLQNVPDNYTAIVSDTARYTILGNGWTIGVIKHIFKGLLNTYETIDSFTYNNHPCFDIAYSETQEEIVNEEQIHIDIR